MERLSDVVNDWKKDCHHVFDVKSVFYDAPHMIYHFEVKCTKCGYIRRALDFTADTFDWHLAHPETWTGWFGGSK